MLWDARRETPITRHGSRPRPLKPCLPYMNEACAFDLTHTRALIPDYDSWFPLLTLDYLRKVIKFQRHQKPKDQQT